MIINLKFFPKLSTFSTLVLVVFWSLLIVLNSTSRAEYEPYEGPPHEDNIPQDIEFPGIRFIELHNPHRATADKYYEGERPLEFTGFTLVHLTQSPVIHATSSPVGRAVSQKIFLSAQEAYLDEFRSMGELPEEMLAKVPSSPDRFDDGRSDSLFIVKGSAQEIGALLRERKTFPKELFRASLRFSRVSYSNPLLPFEINLGLPRPSTEPFSFDRFREGQKTVFSIVSSGNYPYSRLDSFDYEVLKNRGQAIGGVNELKSFMIRGATGEKRIDWMPLMVQYAASQGVTDKSGFVFDKATGQVRFGDDPKIMEHALLEHRMKPIPWQEKIAFTRHWHARQIGRLGHEYQNGYRFVPIQTARYAAEVMLKTSDYEAYLSESSLNPRKSIPPLLAHYFRLGFELDATRTQVHPQYPHLTIAILGMSDKQWADMVRWTEGRPGMKTLLNTIDYHRSVAKAYLYGQSGSISSQSNGAANSCRQAFLSN